MRRLRFFLLLILMTVALPLAARLQDAIDSPIDPDALPILINARTDLELLVNQTLGSERPVGWSGSLDVTTPDLPLLIRLDLELLAGTLIGQVERPAGWFGAVGSTPVAIARDIRHDLELLADAVNGPNIRPPGWAGSDPLMRCSRATQALVNWLESQGGFTLTASINDPDFCQKAELEASLYVEAQLAPAASSDGQAASGPVTIDSPFAVAFLDRFARQPVGSIPLGTSIEPVARSYTEFSRMMLVRGDGFEVFMDWDGSTLTEAQFRALPDVNSIASATDCAAEWCTGE
ncbi:MAG: hypothetical protein JNM70_08825 [Anaerolineae bacterium]|nr:hypothetical protein [Anaerolineae bacterium]